MSQIFIANQEASYLKCVAHYFLESALMAVEQDGKFVLALSGGSTPKKLFSLLTDEYYSSRIPWNKIYLFWVDERCVPPQHPDSNYGMTKQWLLSKVNIPESHVFRMPGEMTPPHAAAKASAHHVGWHIVPAQCYAQLHTAHGELWAGKRKIVDRHAITLCLQSAEKRCKRAA